jgi:hypothetical protein
VPIVQHIQAFDPSRSKVTAMPTAIIRPIRAYPSRSALAVIRDRDPALSEV